MKKKGENISPIFPAYLLWLVVTLTHVGLRLWLRLTWTGSTPTALSSYLGLNLLGLFHLPDRSKAEWNVIIRTPPKPLKVVEIPVIVCPLSTVVRGWSSLGHLGSCWLL